MTGGPYDEDDTFGADGDAAEVSEEVLDAAAASGDLADEGDGSDDAVLDAGSMAPDLAALSVGSGSSAVAAPVVQPDLPVQLSGAMPLLLLSKSAQCSSMIPTVARAAARVTAGQIGVGVVVRLPSQTVASSRQYLSRFGSSPVRIADPDLFRAPSAGSPDSGLSPRTSGWHPWLAAAPPVADPVDSAWVSHVLDLQTSVGATVLLSATGWVSSASGATQLAHAMRWVAQSRAHAGSTPMFVNLTLDGSWLTNTALRNALLHEMVESSERLWYLRFRWPVVQPRYGQLRDRALLEGYKELCVTATLEGKSLVLPNSGLTGWVGTALGATGFSTGPGWGEQAYAEQQRMGSQPGQRRPPPTLRYFERSALHTVDLPSHTALLGQSGYLLCRCRFCRSLSAAAPSPASWNKEVSLMHYLLRCARLTALLAGGSRRTEALREVRRARTFASSLGGTPAALTGNNAPAHLAEWERLLL